MKPRKACIVFEAEKPIEPGDVLPSRVESSLCQPGGSLGSMRGRSGGVLLVFAAVSSACAHGKASLAPQPPALAVAFAPPENATDPLIARADAHLDAGLAELRQGHLNGGRQEFDRAVEVYLTAPGGAYANPQVADAYRRTLDAIQLKEVEALAAGDGFTEAQAEPASIDQVSDIAMAAETGPASEQTRRTAEAAVGREVNDFPVVLNDSVLGCVDLYQGRLRDWFTAALSRGGRYLPRIRKIFAEEGVPQDLAYLGLVESAFKPTALSRARAKGVWQFISSTGRRYGLQQDWWVDERSDFEKATRAAAKYLNQLHGMFGDWNLAMAAYNAGEATVTKAIARYGTRDYWALSQTRGLRRETKSYVPLIHAAIVVAKAPQQYGFAIEPEDPVHAESVPVHGAVDLRVIAECAGTSLDQVRALNPELRRLSTPAGRTYEIDVPEGSGAALASCLSSLPPEKRVRFRTHVVARGQSLYTIARRYGVRTADVASANGLSPRKALAVGTELIIPIPAEGPGARPVSVARSRPEGADGASRPARISYRVRRGDTLGSIASQYGITVKDIQTWNGLNGTVIVAGNTLTLFTPHKF
jgi:peptidoglycan lytic transglycosylase D